MGTSNSSISATKKMLGSWRLPQSSIGTVVATFSPDGMFLWHNSSTDLMVKAKEIAIGASCRGNWHVHTKRLASPSTLIAKAICSEASSWFSKPNLKTLSAPMEPCRLELVLNFTALPESCLNLNLLGLRCDLANWLLNAVELFGQHHHELLELDDQSLEIRLFGVDQVWHKVS